MNALLEIALSNAAVAAVLALLVAAVTVCKPQPALVHALWMIVLLKLVTPPVASVAIPGWTVDTPSIDRATASYAANVLPASMSAASRDAALPRETGFGPFAAGATPRDDKAETTEVQRTALHEKDTSDAGAIPGSSSQAELMPPLENAFSEPRRAIAPAVRPQSVQPWWPSWQVVIGTVWLSGSLAWFVVAAFRIVRFQCLLCLARRAPAELQVEVDRLAGRLGLTRAPQTELVNGRVSPLVWPLARRVRLVFPSGLIDRLSADERTTLLAHELVHVRRRDHWVRLVELAATGLYWWHPVVWWARRHLRAAEEECCDAWVVETWPELCGSYARALVAAVGFLCDAAAPSRLLPGPASGLGELGALRQRLTNILEGNRPARLTPRRRWLLATMALVLLPLVPGRTAQQAKAAEPSAAAVEVKTNDDAAAPADPDDRPLAGVVVDGDAQAAAGADVWLLTSAFNGPEVLAHALADAAGGFRFVVPGRWFQTNVTLRQELGLLAYKPRSRPAALGFDRRSMPPESGVQLVLEPRAESSFRLLDPDGQPVLGAEVALTAVAADGLRADMTVDEARTFSETDHLPFRHTAVGPIVGRVLIPLPEDLSRTFVARTNAQGNAAFPGLALDDVAAVTIKSPVYGEQLRALNFVERGNEARGWPDTIRMATVGSLSGRVVSDDSAAVGRLTFTVKSVQAYDSSTYVPGSMSTLGVARVTTDDEGRFEVPFLAQGGLTFAFPAINDGRLRAHVPPNRSVQVKAGRRTTIEIPLVRAVRAGGVVRERGTKRAIVGITVMVLDDAADCREVLTDDEGRYECFLAPGEAVPVPRATSRFVPLDGEEHRRLTSNIPVDATEFEFPPIELTPAPKVRGRVVDGDGRPAPGARVWARWLAQDRRVGLDLLNDRETVADQHGEFELLGVDPNKELHIEARSPAGWGAATLTLRADAEKPLTIRLVAKELVALAGRVVDVSGVPVAGASVTIFERPWIPEGYVITPRPVKFDGGVDPRTDAEGRFETPRELSRRLVYQAQVRGTSEEAEQTAWLGAADSGTASFDDLVVRRLRTIAGHVADRNGHALADATVFQAGDATGRQESITDAGGRFRLSLAAADPTFLFVSKPGYRFRGRLVAPKADDVDVLLARADETPAKPMVTLPQALPKDEGLALARRLLEPALKQAVEKGDQSNRLRVLELLARIDPADVLARVENKPFADSRSDDYLRRAAALTLAGQDIHEALTVVEAIRDPSFRVQGYLDVWDILLPAERRRSLDLLDQALVETRQIAGPWQRLIKLGLVAERQRDVGQKDRAEELLREGRDLARELANTGMEGYARGAFAKELAQADPAAALELTKDLTDSLEYERHHGNIAHELAAVNPAEAERVLGMLRDDARKIMRCQYAVRVCYRMAPVDLERARGIAERIVDPYLKAQAHGVMAQALAESQPEAATDLLRRAFALLDAQVRAADLPNVPEIQRDHFNNSYSASSLAGSLLPAAERIDPSLVEEFFWQAVSFRLPRTGNEQQAILADRSNAALAMTLARYDRRVAGALLELLARRQPSWPAGGSEAFFAAAVLVDPARAVEVVEGLPEGIDRTRATLVVVELLTREGNSLWRKVQDHLGLWSIDVEDQATGCGNLGRTARRQVGSGHGKSGNFVKVAAFCPSIVVEEVSIS